MTTINKILCTFPGKFGDILWSLATVQHISRTFGVEVDFACMPQYLSLLPLIAQQNYIENAHVLDDWICTGSPCGDQPWKSPEVKGYDKTYDLGYRCHPSSILGGPNIQLIDFIAVQQGFKLETPVPFLTAVDDFCFPVTGPFISFSFNEYAYDMKMKFLNELLGIVRQVSAYSDVKAVDVGTLPWVVAAATIKKSTIFIGCRSSNWVIANGLKKPILTYEPHPERNLTGSMGHVFGCTYGDEHAIAYNQILNTQNAAESAARVVFNYLEKEKSYANA